MLSTPGDIAGNTRPAPGQRSVSRIAKIADSTSCCCSSLMTMNGDTLTETTSGGGQNPLSAKVTQILGTSYTDYAVRSALEDLSLQFTENTPSSRRQLRANLELQDIQSAGALLEQYEQVLAVHDTVISADILVKSLDNLKANVAQVTETCKIMQLHTTAAAMQISRSLADAELLQSRRDQIGTKHTILSAFQDVFTLPEEQIILLTSTSEPVDERFFDIFDKVKTIHSSCQSLLTTENNRAGYVYRCELKLMHSIEIMDQMNRHLDFAFQKLFTWIQRLFKSIQYESPEVDPIARRAIRTLAERPALFQYPSLPIHGLQQKMSGCILRNETKSRSSRFHGSPHPRRKYIVCKSNRLPSTRPPALPRRHSSMDTSSCR